MPGPDKGCVAAPKPSPGTWQPRRQGRERRSHTNGATLQCLLGPRTRPYHFGPLAITPATSPLAGTPEWGYVRGERKQIMNAAVVHSFDKPPNFEAFREPVSSGDEVLIHVRAAALKPVDKQQIGRAHV